MPAIRILGFAGFSHDAAVALLVDGKISMALESEKLTRHKHETSLFPHECVRFVLEQAGLELQELDYIATNWDARPASNLFYLRQLAGFLRRHCYSWHAIPLLVTTAGSHHRSSFEYYWGDNIPAVVPIQHHLAHLGSCYTVSPFEEAAVAIVDGSGEWECTSLYYCAGRKIKKLYSMNLPLDSLGHLYLMSTIHLGYSLGDEYKVMGMAAYGERNQKYEQFFRNILELLPGGRYRVNRRLAGNYFNRGFRFPASVEAIIGPRRRHDEELAPQHMDFARALQARIEEAVLHVIRELKRRTRSRHLCMAGGVALNCLANQRVREEGGFEEVFIQPAAHDGGTSLGAAAYLYYHKLGRPRPEPMRSPYLGPSFDNESIETALIRGGVTYERVDDVEDAAASLLADGLVIGWFQGRAEFGPRALGNRSILADPRDAGMKQRVNRIVKEREEYRPFAPAVLSEAMTRYFADLTESPYMLLTGSIRPERRLEIPAVVHADGTARVQSVSRELSPRFHRLLERFEGRTGVPVLLNTSFNVAGEPIVLSPSQAIRCFYGSGLDALVMGDFVVLKDAHEKRLAQVAVSRGEFETVTRGVQSGD